MAAPAFDPRVLDEPNASILPKNQDFTMKVEDIAKWSA